MMSLRKSQLAGLVLIGGQSERMGRDKATLRIRERPLWEIAARTLQPLVDQVMFLGWAASLSASFPYPILADDPPGRGPLGGIATGLEKSGYAHHLLMAVDYPLVRRKLLRLLLARSAGVLAVCGRSRMFLEPMLAYYHASCAPEIRKMLAEGEYRTNKLFERVPAVVISDEEYDRVDPERLSQVNVNTPADVERAIELMRELDSASFGEES